MKKNRGLFYINILLMIAIIALLSFGIANEYIPVYDFDEIKSYIIEKYEEKFDNHGFYADMEQLDGVAVLVDEPKNDVVNTGEAYEFPEEFYPYRAMLSEDGKKIYNQVYENAMLINESFALVSSVPAEEFENVMCAVYNDHPELFWLETSYSYGYKENGDVVSVDLVFNMKKDEIEAAKVKFNSAAMAVISETRFIEDSLEKEKYVHDYIINNVVYDADSKLNQSAYSALVNGSSVCAGYARAFQYIMIEIGIPCYYCTGYANGGNHAWNLVMVGSELLNVDVSWDDYDTENISESIRYKYFNLKNIEIEQTHIRTGLSEFIK